MTTFLIIMGIMGIAFLLVLIFSLVAMLGRGEREYNKAREEWLKEEERKKNG